MNIFANNLIFIAAHSLPGPIAYVMVKETTGDFTMATIAAVVTILVAFLIYNRMGLYNDTTKKPNNGQEVVG